MVIKEPINSTFQNAGFPESWRDKQHDIEKKMCTDRYGLSKAMKENINEMTVKLMAKALTG